MTNGEFLFGCWDAFWNNLSEEQKKYFEEHNKKPGMFCTFVNWHQRCRKGIPINTITLINNKGEREFFNESDNLINLLQGENGVYIKRQRLNNLIKYYNENIEGVSNE